MKPTLINVSVLSDADGHRGHINLGTGDVHRTLKQEGFTHVEVSPSLWSNSILSLYPRKGAGRDTVPIQFKVHGGAFVVLETPGKWRRLLNGKGVVRAQMRTGRGGFTSSMRLLIPGEAAFAEAKQKLAQLPHYPSMDAV